MARRKKLTLGVIGAGMIGDVHIDKLRKDGRAEVNLDRHAQRRDAAREAGPTRVPRRHA